VLQADLLRTKDVRATHELVIRVIAGVRAMPGMENATCVLQLESNLAFECQHIVHAIQRAGVTKWVALSEGQGGTIGWLTTNERKEAMWCAARPALPRRPLTPPCARSFQLRDCLRVGNISLAKGFFSVKQEPAETIRAMRDELCRFSIITEPPKTLFGKVRKTYSGKMGGLNDDLAIVMQLAITGLRCFYSNPKYNNFHEN